jgi:hypothetical protein
MALPNEIKLPPGERSYQFVEKDFRYNSNYDIVWSFDFKVPGDLGLEGNSWQAPESAVEYAFGTFLTTLTSEISSLPGQYVGDQDPSVALSAVSLLSEASLPLLTESNENLVIDSTSLSGQLIKIVFDTTGLYGLSGRDGRDGVKPHEVRRNSLCIRDFNKKLVFYEELSTFSPTIPLTADDFTTLRFRYANLGTKISIDRNVNTKFETLTTVSLPLELDNFDNLDVFVGYSFTTPVSTSSPALSVGKFFLRDPHVEGLVTTSVITETLTTKGNSFNPNSNTTTAIGISAIADQKSLSLLDSAEQNINIFRIDNNISADTVIKFQGILVDDGLDIQTIGTIPKERADDFAIDNNIIIDGNYRGLPFSIPDNSLSIFS